MSYTELQACALKPDDTKCIGKRGGRTYLILNSIWKYHAQLTSFSLQCSITWLHEDQFCSAIWAVKLGLERAGLYAQLCHKQSHIAAVIPAPAVSRISQERFSSSQGCPWQRKLLVQESQSDLTCWDCCSGIFSLQRERDLGTRLENLFIQLLVLGWEQKATMK